MCLIKFANILYRLITILFGCCILLVITEKIWIVWLLFNYKNLRGVLIISASIKGICYWLLTWWFFEISISISLLQFIAPKNVFEVESVFFITVHLANKLVFVLEHFLGSRGMVRSAVTIRFFFNWSSQPNIYGRNDYDDIMCTTVESSYVLTFSCLSNQSDNFYLFGLGPSFLVEIFNSTPPNFKLKNESPSHHQ